MKIIYKILFSLCSTIVCCAHSVRSFAASCTIHSTLPSDACEYPTTDYTNLINYGIHGAHCKSGDQYLTLKGFIKTLYNKTLDCYTYAALYDCNTCPTTGYTKKTQTFTINSELAKCSIQYTVCEEKAQACTTNAECVTKLGASTRREYYTSQIGEELVAYADFTAKCKSNNCVYEAPFSFVKQSGSNDIYFSSAAGLTCYNTTYGSPTIFSQAGETFIVGCLPCPDIDATYMGFWQYGNYLRGEGSTAAGCYIHGVTINNTTYTKFKDTTGNFDIISDCYY